MLLLCNLKPVGIYLSAGFRCFFNIDIYDKLIILNKILNGYGYMTKISTETFFTQ